MPASESGDYNRDALATDLAALIDQARTAGVDLRGGYDMRAADETVPEYAIEISEVRRPSAE